MGSGGGGGTEEEEEEGWERTRMLRGSVVTGGGCWDAGEAEGHRRSAGKKPPASFLHQRHLEPFSLRAVVRRAGSERFLLCASQLRFSSPWPIPV